MIDNKYDRLMMMKIIYVATRDEAKEGNGVAEHICMVGPYVLSEPCHQLCEQEKERNDMAKGMKE
jgi:hypothetical protein